MDSTLTVAIQAAQAAGALIMQYFDKRDTLSVTTKAFNDFVSEVDCRAEQEVVAVLKDAYPNHSILGEEGGRQGGTEDEFVWIIDPLDGTTNFLRGIPHFAVSIALVRHSEIICGVIYDPVRQELFTAMRGMGAQMNGRALRVAQQTDFPSALLGTGFPLISRNVCNVYFEMLRTATKQGTGIRRGGAAALDMAWVACGRIDGFWEICLKPWDIAAGVVLIEEAGGLVTDFAGGHAYLKTGDIVAACPALHRQMYEAFLPHAACLQRHDHADGLAVNGSSINGHSA